MNQRLMSKKILLVNRDFQFRYTGAGLAAGCVSTVITATLILYPLFAFKILTIGIFLPWPIFACMLVAVILNVLVQLIFGIVMTHKVAGPMFSIVKNIRKLGAGRWNIKMHQRPGDDLEMIVRHINELSENLVVVAKNDLETLAKIKSSVAKLSGDQNEKELLLATVDDLANSISERIAEPKGLRNQNA
jgi:hypothetical protein